MDREIKYIVHTISRYNDYFGNTYHFARITRTSTGKSVVIDDCPEGNAVAILSDADSSLNRHSSQPIHRINEWEKATEWKRRRKFARGFDGANSTTPLNPYNSETTAKAIRALSSKATPEYTGADVDLNAEFRRRAAAPTPRTLALPLWSKAPQRPTQARKNRDPMNDTTRQQIIELLTTPPTNGDTHTMEFISDSSHGWLKVPVSAYQLAEAPASRFSYTDSENVYLEEDSDAPRFLKAVGIVNRDSGLELDNERWYIPERNLSFQRRYNEVSPRDMASLNDPKYRRSETVTTTHVNDHITIVGIS